MSERPEVPDQAAIAEDETASELQGDMSGSSSISRT